MLLAVHQHFSFCPFFRVLKVVIEALCKFGAAIIIINFIWQLHVSDTQLECLKVYSPAPVIITG